jgi:hypothetical protein
VDATALLMSRIQFAFTVSFHILFLTGPPSAQTTRFTPKASQKCTN